MTKLEILTYPHSLLNEVADPFETVDESVAQLLADMLETMYEDNGIGLAAPQIGLKKRLAIVDVGEEFGQTKPLYMFNPKVLWSSEKTQIVNEGCLSIPDIFFDVERPDEVEIEYIDEKGVKRSLKADGLLSCCIQHEIDHLNGILFIDYLSPLKKKRILKKYDKFTKRKEAVIV